MNTTRVVIIDDEPKDAVPLLLALSSAGIGAIYIAGDNVATLPTPPLDGIRLVFLDLNLNGQHESKKYIPYAAEVLQRAIACSPRSVGIVCWTRHTAEVEDLKTELTRRNLEPAFVKAIDDKIASSKNSAQSMADLTKEINLKLAEEPGRCLLVQWEDLVHRATTNVANSLIGMCPTDVDLTGVLATIATAASMSPLTDASGAQRSVSAGLSSMHADSVDAASAASAPWMTADKLFEAVGALKVTRSSLEHRARLNSILLSSGAQAYSPGNVYDCSIAGSLAIKQGKEVRRFLGELFRRNFAATPEGNAEFDAWKKALDPRCIPICVELTPACDHASGKTELARFIGGLLIPVETGFATEAQLKMSAESRLYARDVEPMWLESNAPAIKGVHKMFLTARQLFAMSIADVHKATALFRFRHPVVADIQAWFASHAARPGYISVH